MLREETASKINLILNFLKENPTAVYTLEELKERKYSLKIDIFNQYEYINIITNVNFQFGKKFFLIEQYKTGTSKSDDTITIYLFD